MKQKLAWSCIVTLCISFIFSTRLQAQNKLNEKQYFNKLPTIRWAGDNHYKIYKRSDEGKGQWFIVDVKSGKEKLLEVSKQLKSIFPVAISRKKDEVIFKQDGKATHISNVQNATFSPDSSQIAFTRNKDLYVLDVSTKKEWRVTNDASNDVYNGWSSWVYNEEILGRGTAYRAFWWSPDSRRIVFMRFDDSKVPVHILYDDKGIHGTYHSEHYPQPGDPNPEVRIGIADTREKNINWADYDERKDQYFGTPIWRPDGQAVWIQWMNRRQDSLKIDEVDLADGSHRNVYTETQKTWIALDQGRRIIFLPTQKMFLVLSDKSGWMHLYAYSMDGKFIQQITNGDWSVDEIEYIDKKNDWIYFTAKKESIVRNDLYKVKLDGTNLKRLTFGDYTHSVDMSPKGNYFVTSYSNFATPERIAVLNSDGKIIREIADEKGKDYADFKDNRDTILYVKTSDGFDLPVRIKWARNIDPSKKYPVLINIYGGPGRGNVFDGYRSNSRINDEYPGIIHVTMDHRGSGLFGKAGEDYLYGHLGKWEIHDYSTVIKWLEHKFPFIDSNRVGITGFSYGGYLTCLALTKGADVFTCGIAGGSVTDWRLYDTHYTERYMGLPKDNPQGYKEASVMNYVENYKGVLRLEQGTVDDNVHLQNTLQLVNALIEAGKHFELMLYPGSAHGWLLNRARFKHTKEEKDAFIKKNLLNE